MDFLLELILPLLELLYLPPGRPSHQRERAAKRAEITTILSHSVMILRKKSFRLRGGTSFAGVWVCADVSALRASSQ